MIYFDKPTQQQVVERLVSRLEPGGYLFVGHSESLTAAPRTGNMCAGRLPEKRGRVCPATLARRDW
jgi:chemotaxis methyl-accepting protein methylase